MAISDDLKATRARLGESQAQFGTRFGVDQSTVHRWETDGVSDRGTARRAIELVLADMAASETPPSDRAEAAQ